MFVCLCVCLGIVLFSLPSRTKTFLFLQTLHRPTQAFAFSVCVVYVCVVCMVCVYGMWCGLSMCYVCVCVHGVFVCVLHAIFMFEQYCKLN